MGYLETVRKREENSRNVDLCCDVENISKSFFAILRMLNRCASGKRIIVSSVVLFITLVFTDICQAQWTYGDLPDTNITRVQSLVCLDKYVFAATWGNNQGSVYKSTNNGVSWSLSNNGLPFGNFNDLKCNKNILYAAIATEGIYRSTDYGEHWVTLNNNLKNNDVKSITIYNDTIYVVGATSAFSNGTFRTNDEGNNWDTLRFNTDKIFSKNNSAWFIATVGKISVSIDQGKNWANNIFWNHSSTITEAILVSDENVYAGCHAESFPSTFYNGIFISHDNGKNWLQTSNVRAEAFALARNYVYACGYAGEIISSNDNGTTWNSINEGISNQNSFYAISASDSLLFVAGQSKEGNNFVHRIWKRPLSELTGVENSKNEILPNSIYLSQNYPNPFNPTTTIEYQVPKQSKVVVRVLDLLGREIETSVNEEEAAGNYSVKFDGSNYSSGVYFYQLIANGTVITKKFVLMK